MSIDDREFKIWLNEKDGKLREAPLRVGETYTLNFQLPVPEENDQKVGVDLQTNWVMVASDIELTSIDDAIDVSRGPNENIYNARGNLLLPEDTESEVVQVNIKPLKNANDPSITVLFFVEMERYRQIRFDLLVQ